MRIVMIAAAMAGLAGCATITRGTAQNFSVESTPSGAAVETSNGFKCAATPCEFRIPRKHGFTVNLTLDGYLPAQATVTSGMSGGGTAGMAGNVLIGGLIGIGVDASSGAMNDLSPNPLHVVLQPVPAAPAEAQVAEASVPSPMVAEAAALAVAEAASAVPPAATTPDPGLVTAGGNP